MWENGVFCENSIAMMINTTCWYAFPPTWGISLPYRTHPWAPLSLNVFKSVPVTSWSWPTHAMQFTSGDTRSCHGSDITHTDEVRIQWGNHCFTTDAKASKPTPDGRPVPLSRWRSACPSERSSLGPSNESTHNTKFQEWKKIARSQLAHGLTSMLENFRKSYSGTLFRWAIVHRRKLRQQATTPPRTTQPTLVVAHGLQPSADSVYVDRGPQVQSESPDETPGACTA